MTRIKYKRHGRYVLFLKKISLYFCVLLVLNACAAVISPYDAQAYKNATEFKAQANAILAKAIDPYSKHESAVEKLLLNVNSAYEYSAGIPKNKIATEQWQLLRDPSGKLLGGFIEKWKLSGNNGFGEVFVQETSSGIAKAFDYIICLEVNKKESTACSTL